MGRPTLRPVDDPGRLRSLEQELRDERARRRAAESRIDELSDRAALWRGRAEERAEAINRLQQAQATNRGRLKQKVRRVGASIARIGRRSPASEAESDKDLSGDPPRTATARHAWPAIRSIMVVAAVTDPSIQRCLSSFDTIDLTKADDVKLERADFAVVEPATWPTLPFEAQSRLKAWAAQSGRQPLVIWTTRSDISLVGDLPGARDLIAVADVDIARSVESAVYLPGCLDPELHHPSPSSGDTPVQAVDDYRTLLATPPIGVVEASASGIGFDDAPGAGTAARRWAYRNHAPWVRARHLLDLIGVRAPDPIPRVAAILVSHRPQSIPSTIRAVLGQTHSATELVVGIHGAEPTQEIEAVLGQAAIPVELVVLEANLTLGACLNEAIDRTSAPLLAKIDDDDHYGPAYLEDSFHALAYSGAGIVGKGSQYVYVASRDETVLRRPGLEEVFIDGSPNGASLVLRRMVWEEVGFPDRPRHVDTGFLRAARSIGTIVYAGSRWEFCYVRNPSGHTWDAEEAMFVAGSDRAWAGFHPERVEVADLDAL